MLYAVGLVGKFFSAWNLWGKKINGNVLLILEQLVPLF